MKELPCINCGRDFPRSPRHKNQNYCQRKSCQRAKNADWQRNRMRTDPEYRAGQKLSQKKWVSGNPDYWKQYRARNPESAERNRLLQRVRNQKRRGHHGSEPGARESVIAKMDASKQEKPGKFKLMGQYWLVPMIAKMDPLKANIVAIPAGYD